MDKITELIIKAQQGDKEAVEEILTENSGLIWSVVKRFTNRGVEAEDLYQIGAMGMLKAVKRFDCGYEVKFSTYAVPMIMGEIKRYLRDDGIIKISRPVKEMAIKLHHIQQEITAQTGEQPSVQQLAEAVGASAEEVVVALEAGCEVESLNAVVYQGDSSEISLMELVAQDDESEKTAERIDLHNAIERLNARERKIIQMRYFQDKTQTEVARAVGVSQVQISRIEKRVLRCMRDFVG